MLTAVFGAGLGNAIVAVGITRPCVKHNFLVKDVRDLAATFKKAFHIACTGRPGPVLIDIPKDVSRDRCGFSYPKTVAMRSYTHGVSLIASTAV